ncbi:MAG: hypothetical protein LC781_20260 [Actinobacteria bacterium]|nr:hypothetical protein [Actinomycetota bacterium]
MIRVWVEVSGEADRFRVEVRADSIERAVRLAGSRYPGREARVFFPIDPEAFVCEEPVPPAVWTVLPEAPELDVGRVSSGTAMTCERGSGSEA